MSGACEVTMRMLCGSDGAVVLLVGTGADFGSRIGRDPTLVNTRLTSESAPTSSTSSAAEKQPSRRALAMLDKHLTDLDDGVSDPTQAARRPTQRTTSATTARRDGSPAIVCHITESTRNETASGRPGPTGVGAVRLRVRSRDPSGGLSSPDSARSQRAVTAHGDLEAGKALSVTDLGGRARNTTALRGGHRQGRKVKVVLRPSLILRFAAASAARLKSLDSGCARE